MRVDNGMCATFTRGLYGRSWTGSDGGEAPRDAGGAEEHTVSKRMYRFLFALL